MPLKPISVSQLNEYISRVLVTDPLLGNVTVKGETSGVKYHQSGHVYFSLVDARARVNCFLNRELAADLRFRVADGMEVTIVGSVSVYQKGGSYSLYVRSLETEGAGSLQLAFEEMKQKLSAEGLFDPAKKKPLPFFPDHIGIVTSETGAAIRDMMKNIKPRNNHVSVTVFPVLVQGDAAAGQIARAIRTANEKFPYLDVLIVGRGGGSPEDLWAFNEEVVARAIYGSEIPVISAVGHEIDFTISDMAADVRAETPTKAAVIAVPDLDQLEEELEKRRSLIERQLDNGVMFQELRIDNLIRSMRSALENRIDRRQKDVEKLRMQLELNDPRKILENGYSILEDEAGRVMTDAGELQAGGIYRVRLARGSAEMKALRIDLPEALEQAAEAAPGSAGQPESRSEQERNNE
ncbi:Exodeoxyribonuclease VII large subunit [Eubacterium pyruvativorans]|uniref:Exodeoxyribonuclease 7 large subunit n=3 Tax=Eubacterium pyruvativorans TaxID=155865 RepID=A0A1I7EYW0_9FIRM|nr:exodeoxyribonuclease VII large subunit [Eubacterium pyruvativorans]MDD6707687.1 exodeoxyribonuclease VII large subunit [Eubacterium pyruvativorans]SFN91936.1 Exodeoxyribonuclease VII large subunit [Eubacterium pyruvativorans]SFU29089.1 Exodeoxyribonuclease VII large subunit [Eubacterium pyruvativorans]